jgi:hypothetical protein
MTAREQLLQEIQYSPEQLIKEVLDFLLFTRSKNYPQSASQVLSECNTTGFRIA